MNAVFSPTPSPESRASDLLQSRRAVARETCRFLIRLREFDLHRAYALPGRRKAATDCVDWLNRACGIERDAAREQLRVAYCLMNLPTIETAFESGELSYTKVRALTRVATAVDEASLLDFARAMTDAQVEDYCLRMRERQRKAA